MDFPICGFFGYGFLVAIFTLAVYVTLVAYHH